VSHVEYVPRPCQSTVVYPTITGGVGIDFGAGALLLDYDEAQRLAQDIAHILRLGERKP
jgi:hypothetical protein